MELRKDFKGSKFHNRQGEQDFYQAIFAFDSTLSLILLIMLSLLLFIHVTFNTPVIFNMSQSLIWLEYNKLEFEYLL